MGRSTSQRERLVVDHQWGITASKMRRDEGIEEMGRWGDEEIEEIYESIGPEGTVDANR